VKQPFVWSDAWQETFGAVCAARWGFRYRQDDLYTLRNVVERAYQASDVPDLAAFAALLRELPDQDPEIQAFVGQMTVGETSFFRNRPQFDALSTHLLPELVERRREEGVLTLKIWSAGCASGEEPYSLAITLAELLPDWPSWEIRILATDINPYSLRRAQEALYTNWSFREVEPGVVRRYFTKVRGLLRMSHPCAKVVRFMRHNLITDRVPNVEAGLFNFDLIVCRNVTIYFDRETTARLADRFYAALRPEGWLMVGHTEPDIEIYARYDHLDFPDTIIYRRPLIDKQLEPRRMSHPEERPAETVPDEVVELPSLDDCLAAYEAGDLASAYELLAVLAQHRGDDPLPTHYLAQIAADERRYDEALYWGFTALQHDPFHVPTLLLMGVLDLEAGKLDRARQHLNQAIFLDPRCPEAHLYLSMVYRSIGDEERSRKSRERARQFAIEQADADAALLPVQRPRRSLL
jgi:chemotaxis protein methyltransferase CheR